MFLVAVETENDWVEWTVNNSVTSLRNRSPNNLLSIRLKNNLAEAMPR